MELVILSISIFILGWVLGNWNAIKTFSRILQRLGVTDQQLKTLHEEVRPEQPEPEPGVVRIKIEKIGGALYAYTVDSDSFLAQGSTAEDLLKGIVNRLPVGSRVICSVEHGGDLIESALKNG